MGGGEGGGEGGGGISTYPPLLPHILSITKRVVWWSGWVCVVCVSFIGSPLKAGWGGGSSLHYPLPNVAGGVWPHGPQRGMVPLYLHTRTQFVSVVPCQTLGYCCHSTLAQHTLTHTQHTHTPPPPPPTHNMHLFRTEVGPSPSHCPESPPSLSSGFIFGDITERKVTLV